MSLEAPRSPASKPLPRVRHALRLQLLALLLLCVATPLLVLHPTAARPPWPALSALLPAQPPPLPPPVPTNVSALPFADPSATYDHLWPRTPRDAPPDLYFRHEASPVVLRGPRSRRACVVFSCSRSGYALVGPSLAASRPDRCDRVHFFVRTLTSRAPAAAAGAAPVTTHEVTGHWCRVAILRRMDVVFRGYSRVLYVDADVRYAEADFVAAKKAPGQSALLMSSKVERGVTVLRTTWLAVLNTSDRTVAAMFLAWARAYRKRNPGTHLNDQPVFNELFSCSQVRCVPLDSSGYIQTEHCGSFLGSAERIRCMTK